MCVEEWKIGLLKNFYCWTWFNFFLGGGQERVVNTHTQKVQRKKQVRIFLPYAFDIFEVVPRLKKQSTLGRYMYKVTVLTLHSKEYWQMCTPRIYYMTTEHFCYPQKILVTLHSLFILPPVLGKPWSALHCYNWSFLEFHIYVRRQGV